MFYSRVLITILLLNPLNVVFAQQAPLWLKNTAISPDGKQLAFTYQSKIYLTNGTGGAAQPLTDGSFYPHSLIWSPDNQTLAFAADIYGNDDVFSLTLNSGAFTRHTTNSAADIPTSFSADGSNLLFYTNRLTTEKQDFYSIAPYSIGEQGNQLYRLDIESKVAQNILAVPVRSANWNKSNTLLLYNTPHKDQAYRKHQSSYAVPVIWQYDRKTKIHTKITEDKVAAEAPIWNKAGTGFYYLSERSGNFNVWFRDLNSQQDTQMTDYVNHPVRHLSASQAGDLFFSYQGELFRINSTQSEPKKLTISIRNFSPKTTTQYEANYADSMLLSPTNSDEGLLTSNGDIFAFDGMKQTAKNLTNSAAAEKDPTYTTDGYAVIYSALRDNHWGLYLAQSPLDEELLSEAPVVEEHPFLLIEGHDVTQAHFSPNGERLAFVVDGRALHSINMVDYDIEKPLISNIDTSHITTSNQSKGKKAFNKLLDRKVGQNSIGTALIAPDMVSYKDSFNYTWSPDSKQIAVTVTPDASSTEIVVLDSQGEEPMIRASQSGFNKSRPVWSSDNRILMWSTTEFGLKTADGQDWDESIVGVFTNSKARRDHNDEVELPETQESLPFTRKNLEYRQAFQLPVSSQLIDYTLTGDFLTVVANVTDPAGNDSTQVFEYNIRTQESTPLFSDLPPAISSHMVAEQSSVYLLTEGEIYWLNLDSLESESVAISLPIEYENESRRLAAYQQLVKQTEDNFYRKDMGGVDWSSYSKHYKQFLSHINNDRDFAVLIKELLGELNASHTGAYGSSSSPMTYDETADLGIIFTNQVSGYNDNGLIVESILPGGPFDDDQLSISIGDRIIAINEHPVNTLSALASRLKNQSGKTVEVTLGRDEQHWYERVKPIDEYRTSELMTKRWEIKRRNIVSNTTDGKVGYVYLPDMSNDSYLHLRSEALGRFRNADALIIDVRFNGGGFLADTLIEFLTARAAAHVTPLLGKPSSDAGSRSWLKPSLVLTNSYAYSEGSAFGQYYQDLKVGPIVGEPVPGTGTAVMDLTSSVYDPISYRFPFLPLKNQDGKYYENMEMEPDIRAFNTPSQIENGTDNQLNVAIEEAMKLITFK